MLGTTYPDGPGRVERAAEVILHVRQEGRRNLEALQALQAQLAAVEVERSLVRILDAVLWLSHPAAGTGSSPRVFECRAIPRFTPLNVRRIEFLEWKRDEMVSVGEAWVDADGFVQGDTARVNELLDGDIGVPNVLTKPSRMATREDGPAMLHGYLLEASASGPYWGVRVLEWDDAEGVGS